MTPNFYQQKITEINNLIKDSKYQEAYNIVQEELKMPYIPNEYIKKFEIFEQKLIQYLKKDVIKDFVIPLDKIIDMLYGNNKEQETALTYLAKYNLRVVKNKLKKRLELWDNNFKKAFLYEILVDQEIDIDIKINNQIINPTKFSIFKNKETHKAFKKIETLAFKKPYLVEPAFNELRKYLLINFPNWEINGNHLGTIIFNIIDSMFSQKRILNLEEQKIKTILKLK